MTNILFISQDEIFKSDLQNQIEHHTSEFDFIDERVTPDILLIDEDLEALQKYHSQNLKAPTIFLTDNPDGLEDADNINHLIIKPFELSYFLDELRSCLNIYDNSEEGFISFNQYQLRPLNKDIVNLRNGEETKLTEKEVAVIKYLYKFQDRIVSKNELLQDVWGYSPDVTTHTIETHIYRLRQKVERDNIDAQLILTVDGGYQLKI
ncbi:MAG: winged helix-turn-helix domain-containing protein [Alphaproteobacteria bacterium]|nr:hypothetical protein [Alphaproteobacteria bacterium]MBQ7285206.1 winged helix-turn-helix domain-containing protein [Alphaproteobacteria bacterium]